MKKRLIMFLSCILLFTFFIAGSVNAEQHEYENSLPVIINGETTEFSTVFLNNTHYVPMRAVFEKMGAKVFYRISDHQVLALLNNGDMMRHVTGENKVIVNNKDILFVNPSVVINKRTYIPLDMVLSILFPQEFFCDDSAVVINKTYAESEYLTLIKDVLDVSNTPDFRPENFSEYISYHVKNPNVSVNDAVFNVNLGLQYPHFQNVTTIENPHELLVLVNKYNKLPENFTQYNLVHMEKSLTIRDGKEYLLEEGTYQKYVEMENAARNDGLSMRVVSAYRTESYQNSLHTNRKKAYGLAYADAYTARAGHSEHQTGLALDINSTYTTFQYSNEFKWLQEHAHEYGFILRYPKGKEWITGYSYEPWHYRYVGVDVATIIHNEDITFEEYCLKYINVNEFK